MKLIPNKGRIVVLPDTPEQQGVIILPDTAKEKARTGSVIAVCDAHWGLTNGFAVGDRVFYNTYFGTEFKLDGRDVLVFKEDDIYGKLV